MKQLNIILETRLQTLNAQRIDITPSLSYIVSYFGRYQFTRHHPSEEH